MMPSGREIYSLKPFKPPTLEKSTLEDLKTPCCAEEVEFHESSEEEVEGTAHSGVSIGFQSDYSGRGSYY